MEVDSASSVHLLLSAHLAKWPICNILRKTRFLLSLLDGEVCHVFHEINSAAEALASLSLQHDFFWDDVRDLPKTIQVLFHLCVLRL